MFQGTAYTDIGPRKKSNQDSACVEIIETPYGQAALITVCDGVGGLASGELASASLVNWLSNWFESQFMVGLAPCVGNHALFVDYVTRELNIGIDTMNAAIRQHGLETEARLGTTCSVAVLFDGYYAIAQIGDSRVYKVNPGQMSILTQDQTWVAQEVARGNITPETARFHPKRNVILQAVGSQLDIQPVFSSGIYKAGDTFMVCCDGFRNELFDDEIIEGFGNCAHQSESEMYETCERMVKMVLDRGEKDNITVAVLTCQDENDISDDVMPTAML